MRSESLGSNPSPATEYLTGIGKRCSVLVTGLTWLRRMFDNCWASRTHLGDTGWKTPNAKRSNVLPFRGRMAQPLQMAA
jgi:hypothetical protein